MSKFRPWSPRHASTWSRRYRGDLPRFESITSAQVHAGLPTITALRTYSSGTALALLGGRQQCTCKSHFGNTAGLKNNYKEVLANMRQTHLGFLMLLTLIGTGTVQAAE